MTAPSAGAAKPERRYRSARSVGRPASTDPGAFAPAHLSSADIRPGTRLCRAFSRSVPPGYHGRHQYHPRFLCRWRYASTSRGGWTWIWPWPGRGRWCERAQPSSISVVSPPVPAPRPCRSPQEMDRVLPLLERIVAELDVVVSVDTSSPELMTAAAELGAGLLNDVRALAP